MKRHGVHSLLLALALVLLQACATDITANAPKSAPPPKCGETEPTREAPVDPVFMRGFSRLDAHTDSAVGYLERENGEMIGSAVLISSIEIITAGHCAEGGDAAWFVTDGECYRIKKMVTHPCYKIADTILIDLAVGVLETPCAAPPLPLVKQGYEYRRQQPLTAIGFGGGIKRRSLPDLFVYFGTLVEEPTVFKFLPLDGTVWFGDSGGAVLDTDGTLIGIVVSFGICHGHLYENSATRLDIFRKWIEEAAQ
jgi:S1-C subfamily serine protease